MLDESIKKDVLKAQKNEITEHVIYQRLSMKEKSEENSEILERISREELEHYRFWKEHTQVEIRPDRLKVYFYVWAARLFGLTFAVKLMEEGEKRAQVSYEEIAESIPEAKKIIEEEDMHESSLVSMIDEQKLKYVGSMVLGLNDALVELTGALAGFTLALNNGRLVAATGLITGFAASLSMAASEYLSTKSEDSEKDPVKAALYTGSAYLATVFLLIAPYLLISDVLQALAVTLAVGVLIILAFTYYLSVAKGLSFRERFAEMCVISLGVAALSFMIGYLIRVVWAVET